MAISIKTFVVPVSIFINKKKTAKTIKVQAIEPQMSCILSSSEGRRYSRLTKCHAVKKPLRMSVDTILELPELSAAVSKPMRKVETI